jgi:hypothetical protein
MNSEPATHPVWPFAILMAAMLTVGVSEAQAQAATPRYSYRELLTPGTALDCGYQGYGVPLQVNQSGTVVGACQFVKGYTTGANFARCGFTDTWCNFLHPLRVAVRPPPAEPAQWAGQARQHEFHRPDRQR